MATSDFFKQIIANTPTLDGTPPLKGVQAYDNTSPITQALLQSIQKRQHLVCSLPLQAHSPSLYALPAMMSQGVAVIVCPEHDSILQNLEFFIQNGFTYPDICYLDQTILPHDWRDIKQQLDNHRVKLLLTTPETFDTLNFIDLLVHSNISFIGIERAECLYQPLQGRFRYDKLKDAISRFRRKPPISFFFTLLPENKLEEILSPLGLQQANQPVDAKRIELLVHFPKAESLQIKVHHLPSLHQKHKRLINILLQPANLATPIQKQTLLGRLFSPGAAIIRVPNIEEGEALQEYLLQYGFDLVHLWHPQLERSEKKFLEKSFNAEPNQIIIAVADGHRHLKAFEGSHLKLIEWSLPKSIEELMENWFRISSKHDLLSEQALTAHLLFTQDELQSLRTKLKPFKLSPPSVGNRRNRKEIVDTAHKALGQVEEWLKSTDCRVQSFLSLWDPEFSLDVYPQPCGLCDTCQKTDTPLHNIFSSVISIFKPRAN